MYSTPRWAKKDFFQVGATFVLGEDSQGLRSLPGTETMSKQLKQERRTNQKESRVPEVRVHTEHPRTGPGAWREVDVPGAWRSRTLFIEVEMRTLPQTTMHTFIRGRGRGFSSWGACTILCQLAWVLSQVAPPHKPYFPKM